MLRRNMKHITFDERILWSDSSRHVEWSCWILQRSHVVSSSFIVLLYHYYLLSIESKRWWFRTHRSLISYVSAKHVTLKDGIIIFRSQFYCVSLHAWSTIMLGPTIHTTPQVLARLCWNYLNNQSVRKCMHTQLLLHTVRDFHIDGHWGGHLPGFFHTVPKNVRFIRC
jgi:hypothetical protein